MVEPSTGFVQVLLVLTIPFYFYNFYKLGSVHHTPYFSEIRILHVLPFFPPISDLGFSETVLQIRI